MTYMTKQYKHVKSSNNSLQQAALWEVIQHRSENLLMTIKYYGFTFLVLLNYNQHSAVQLCSH